MNSQVEQLKKILQLEKAKGYRDLAVIGGLDSYIRRWLETAKASDPKLYRSISQLYPLSSGYATISLSQRKELVDNLLESLAKTSNRPTIPRRKSRATSDYGESLDGPVTTVKGISSALAGKLNRLRVSNVRHLVYLFPRRHIDYSRMRSISELEVGIDQSIVGTIWQASEKTIGRHMRATEAIVGDETGNIRIVWFNQPYLAKKFRTNTRVVISGRVSLFKGQKVFESPEYEILGDGELTHTGRLVPIYPLTQGLYARTLRRLVKKTVDYWAPNLPDFLPQEVKHHAQLLELSEAIKQAHYPDSEWLRDRARRRLAFDELFLIQLGVLAKRRDWREGEPGTPLEADSECLQAFLASLPFTLTSAQRRVFNEIREDLSQPKPMSRLLQGDVGSGKTVVAAAALLITVASDCQATLMAPTEILAEQHFKTISHLLAGAGQLQEEGFSRTFVSLLPRPITVGLLVGSIRSSDKRELHRRISEGVIDIVIGTHALIQKEVEFNRLGLVVVDEQHRFGVMQRSALRHKGTSPHMLVMSATPIPRTLALTLYGDLDLSVIDELPPGRQEIRTEWISPNQRHRAYEFVRKQISAGRQAFIICPLIEESANIRARASVTEYQRLSQLIFPDLRLGLLHGRMASSKKEKVMAQFRQGKLDILVSTPVVEVGIDVPNATVMVVEGADRFGLSQLHQFRGRVGRGQHQSYCLLLADTPSWEGRERLAIIEKTQDGFALAEEDLRLRGPGEFFGTRQSGLPDLRMAKLSDVELLELARSEAIRLFRDDPWLQEADHQPLATEVARLWKNEGEWS